VIISSTRTHILKNEEEDKERRNTRGEEKHETLGNRGEREKEGREGSEVHRTSYPMGTGGSFPGGKAAGA
jgi:hypothetical protein